jgi:hypothetical protein
MFRLRWCAHTLFSPECLPEFYPVWCTGSVSTSRQLFPVEVVLIVE